jgi:anaerobic selenocysteine-containing dehydrogenase
MPTTVPRTCHLCEAMCGVLIEVDGDRVVSVRPDPDDVFSRGHICPKGPALRELHHDPDRLRQPMRRSGDRWQAVPWDEALDEAAERLHAVQRAHGKSAVGLYIGNPTVHGHGAVLGSQLFTTILGSRNRFDANSQDANPKLFACLRMYGELTSITVPDVDHTSYMLMLGANPAASNGSVMSLGDVRGRLRGIRDRGGRLVLVDPRRTETAAWADEHIAIRPGGDAAWLAALLQVVFSERLGDDAAARALADGLDELRRAVEPFTPEAVATCTGIPADKTREVARQFAAAPAAVAYGRIGLCHGDFSAAASWLCEALNVVTGNFDRPGGAMFPTAAVDIGPIARRLGVHGSGRYRSRVRGLPELGGTLPAATMAEEMETPGQHQIRAMVTVAGNPVLSVPNGERLDRALGALEFMVSVDLYINETTRHANLVLPPVSALERSHYDLVFHAIAVRNTAKWSAPALPPPAGAREDWDILWGLGARLAAHRAGPAAGLVRRALAVAKLSPDRVLDLALRAGPHRLSLAKLKAAPHGLDLGALKPMRATRVRTASGKVALAPPDLVADLPRVLAWTKQRDGGELMLIGRRHLRSNNSWMHNLPPLVSGSDRTALLMHPEDAAARGLASGNQVRIKSKTGEVSARLEVTSDVRRGVVSLPHGFGHARARETMRVAGAVGGPNANALTDDGVVEPLTGSAVLSGVHVEVSPAAQ